MGFGISGVHYRRELEYYKPDLWTLVKHARAERIRVAYWLPEDMKPLADGARENGVKVLFTMAGAMKPETQSPWMASKDLYKARVDLLNLPQFRGHEGIWGYDICNEPYVDENIIDVVRFGLQYVKSVDPTHNVTVGLSPRFWGADYVERRKWWISQFQPYVDAVDMHGYFFRRYREVGGEFYNNLDWFREAVRTHFDEVIIPAAEGKPVQTGETGCVTGTTAEGQTYTEEQQAEYFRLFGEFTKPRGVFVYVFKLMTRDGYGLFRQEVVEGMNKPKLAAETAHDYLSVAPPTPLIVPVVAGVGTYLLTKNVGYAAAAAVIAAILTRRRG